MDAMNIRNELMRKVEKLEIEGFSSMGEFSDAERLAIVQEIERITSGRYSPADSMGTSSASTQSSQMLSTKLQPSA